MIINFIGKTYSTKDVSRYEVIFQDTLIHFDTFGLFTVNIVTTDSNRWLHIKFRGSVHR